MHKKYWLLAYEAGKFSKIAQMWGEIGNERMRVVYEELNFDNLDELHELGFMSYEQTMEDQELKRAYRRGYCDAGDTGLVYGVYDYETGETKHHIHKSPCE